MIYQQVVKLLREDRRKLGLTHDEYAAHLGEDRTRVLNWLQARVEPTFSLTDIVRFRSANPELFEQMLAEAEKELRLKQSAVAAEKLVGAATKRVQRIKLKIKPERFQ